MTFYIAAYDTESPACLGACRKIVAMHRRHEMPATFFITGKTLEADAAEYRDLLGDPLFEVASHTYSHGILREHPFCGQAVSAQQARDEVILGKAAVEKVFERPCAGLRPGCGFSDGLRGAPDLVQLVRRAGFRYVSSLAWGPDYSMPAPLTQPFSYARQDAPDLWELPGHGWHDNLLKDNNAWGARRLALWPPTMPDLIPERFVTSPEEEFSVNRRFIEHAVAESLAFVSLIWHPWSLDRCDPEMRMLDLTFAHVRELGMRTGTYVGLREELTAP